VDAGRPAEPLAATPLVLVVEDDADIAEAISMRLVDDGYRVHVAGTRAEAAAALGGNGGSAADAVDLVVLDLMLPDGDGLDLLRDLRRDPARAGLPVLIVSARGSQREVAAGFEAGSNAYIPKPFRAERLSMAIRLLLEEARIGRAKKVQ
jgi:DNA-binding response OmpR family regulator